MVSDVHPPPPAPFRSIHIRFVGIQPGIRRIVIRRVLVLRVLIPVSNHFVEIPCSAVLANVVHDAILAVV